MRKISWCITLKNRCIPKWEYIPTGEIFSISLLENNLRQLLSLQQSDEHWEICISDWKSTDVNVGEYVTNLISTTQHEGKVTARMVSVNSDKFSRGKGRNSAYNISKFDNIFFLDADMFFKDRTVIDNSYTHLNNQLSYFPICSSYLDRKFRDW